MLASLVQPIIWVPLAAVLSLGALALQQRLLRASFRSILDDTRRLASGGLTQAIDADLSGLPGELQRALGQLSVNLRAVIHDSHTETENLRGAVAEIASGNQHLSSRTEAQARSLEQTADSMSKITTLIEHSASASRRIGDIIHGVEGVAFQTNILALNVAVEAARAGEAGRGFAVVAAEVRNLAQRSADAAREIRQLVQARCGSPNRPDARVDTAHGALRTGAACLYWALRC